MERAEIWKEIENIFEVPQSGIMSTAYGNKPDSRYMIFHNDGRNLYAKAFAESVDSDKIEKNNLAYIILGYDAELESSYLEMLAEMEVVMDQGTIDWLWEWEDHNLIVLEEEHVSIVLKFTPRQIKLMNANDEVDKPEVFDFTG